MVKVIDGVKHHDCDHYIMPIRYDVKENGWTLWCGTEEPPYIIKFCPWCGEKLMEGE